MACRSTDRGKTWSTPETIIDHPLDDGAHAVFVCRDGTVVLSATCDNLRLWSSRDQGKTWSKEIPLDTSSYGYPGPWILDEDESILLPWCAEGRAPNRIYLARFRVNSSRDGIELLPLEK